MRRHGEALDDVMAAPYAVSDALADGFDLVEARLREAAGADEGWWLLSGWGRDGFEHRVHPGATPTARASVARTPGGRLPPLPGKMLRYHEDGPIRIIDETGRELTPEEIAALPDYDPDAPQLPTGER